MAVKKFPVRSAGEGGRAEKRPQAALGRSVLWGDGETLHKNEKKNIKNHENVLCEALVCSVGSHGGVGEALRGAAAVAGCAVLLRPVGARLLLLCRAALAAGLQVVVVFIQPLSRGAPAPPPHQEVPGRAQSRQQEPGGDQSRQCLPREVLVAPHAAPFEGFDSELFPVRLPEHIRSRICVPIEDEQQALLVHLRRGEFDVAGWGHMVSIPFAYRAP